jgi:RND family efflux transporter MFP subunit
MHRIIILGAFLVILVAAAIPILNGAAASGHNPPGSATPTTILREATIDTGDVRLTVSATGNLVPEQQSPISFDQPGRVVEVLVQEGQSVEAGQILARQEDTTQKASLEQAEAALQAAQASLAKLLKPVDARDIQNAEADVKTAQATYSSIANSVPLETIKAYQAQYQQALVAARDAEAIRIEAGGLYGADSPGYQKALAQVGAATLNAEIARLRLQQAQNGHSLLSATANITYFQAKLAQVIAGPSQIQIDTAQAQLVMAQLQRDQAQHQLDKTRLIAPFASIVSTVNIKIGEVSSGPAMVLTDTSRLYADVKVDERNIAKIAPGQPVELSLDALPGVPLTGTVKRIADLSDPNAAVITYVVHIALDATSAPLRVGMTANATFVVAEARQVTRVPNLYLNVDRSLGRTTVTLANADGTFTEVPVQLGVQGPDTSEVIEGLNAGDTVVLLAGRSANQ